MVGLSAVVSTSFAPAAASLLVMAKVCFSALDCFLAFAPWEFFSPPSALWSPLGADGNGVAPLVPAEVPFAFFFACMSPAELGVGSKFT